MKLFRRHPLFLFLILVLALNSCSKPQDCETLLSQAENLEKTSKAMGMPGAAIAMGVASFFLPGFGSLIVGATMAGASAVMNSESKSKAAAYKRCEREKSKEEAKKAKDKNMGRDAYDIDFD